MSIFSSTESEGKCKKVVVKTADGRAFNLGPSSSIFFPLRRALYIWKRRKEFI